MGLSWIWNSWMSQSLTWLHVFMEPMITWWSCIMNTWMVMLQGWSCIHDWRPGMYMYSWIHEIVTMVMKWSWLFPWLRHDAFHDRHDYPAWQFAWATTIPKPHETPRIAERNGTNCKNGIVDKTQNQVAFPSGSDTNETKPTCAIKNTTKFIQLKTRA